jgi:hypothetical protein
MNQYVLKSWSQIIKGELILKNITIKKTVCQALRSKKDQAGAASLQKMRKTIKREGSSH